MYCPSCASSRQAEFSAEINIHFCGLQDLDKPSVLVFPKVLVCLDCGLSRFTTAQAELERLVGRAPIGEPSTVTGPLAKPNSFGQNCA